MLDQSFQAGDGSQASPGYGFLSSPNTGIYRDGAGLAIVVGGVLAARITAGGGLVPGNGPLAVTGAAGVVTVNSPSAVITTEALATAAGATQSYVITNAAIKANSNVLAQATFGTATTGTPLVVKVVPAAGSVTLTIQNIHATVALNGTLLIGLLVQ